MGFFLIKWWSHMPEIRILSQKLWPLARQQAHGVNENKEDPNPGKIILFLYFEKRDNIVISNYDEWDKADTYIIFIFFSQATYGSPQTALASPLAPLAVPPTLFKWWRGKFVLII